MLIDTDKLTPQEIAKELWRENLLDGVKAVEEEVSTITVIKDEFGRKKQWIEETKDLDNYSLGKRIEDHTYLKDGRTDKITHRVYDGVTLYKQWTVDDQLQKTISVEVDHVRAQYHSKISEKSGKIIPEEGVTIICDALPCGLSAIVCGLDKDGQPNGELVYGPQHYRTEDVYDPKTGEVIGTVEVPLPKKVLRATLDVAGNYLLTDVPEHPLVALVYMGEVRMDSRIKQ